MQQAISLVVAGLGLVFYSPWAVANIPTGADFLSQHFFDSDDVAALTNRGAIVGVCTGSPGTYLLKLYSGVLDASALCAADHRVRLCLEVREETLCVRDLYDFLSWDQELPKSQTLTLPTGFYRLTAYTSAPSDWADGDVQVVCVHFEATPTLVETVHPGVPMLCK